MNNYKSFTELKEELGNNYDFKLYEMGISALKEVEKLQQENNQLKLINKEHQQINGELRQANKLLNEQYIRLYKEYEQVKNNLNELKDDLELQNVWRMC